MALRARRRAIWPPWPRIHQLVRRIWGHYAYRRSASPTARPSKIRVESETVGDEPQRRRSLDISSSRTSIASVGTSMARRSRSCLISMKNVKNGQHATSRWASWTTSTMSESRKGLSSSLVGETRSRWSTRPSSSRHSPSWALAAPGSREHVTGIFTFRSVLATRVPSCPRSPGRGAAMGTSLRPPERWGYTPLPRGSPQLLATRARDRSRAS